MTANTRSEKRDGRNGSHVRAAHTIVAEYLVRVTPASVQLIQTLAPDLRILKHRSIRHNRWNVVRWLVLIQTLLTPGLWLLFWRSGNWSKKKGRKH